MSDPFIAEIKIVGFNFAPRGWASCDGQLLPINQNQALFSLLGTIYGGDGRTTFALPDLRGRTPTHSGDTMRQGQVGGEERHTLTTAEIPNHRHPINASSRAADAAVAAGNVLGAPGSQIYGAHASATATPLIASSIAASGGNQAHENMQPYLTVHFVIALTGTFPSRN